MTGKSQTTLRPQIRRLKLAFAGWLHAWADRIEYADDADMFKRLQGEANLPVEPIDETMPRKA